VKGWVDEMAVKNYPDKNGKAQRAGIARVGWMGLYSAVVALLITLSMAPKAMAFKLYESDNVRVNWDNTLKYSLLYRLSDPDNDLISNPNTDDGDRNFDKGISSNRVDLLSEFDASYKNVGVRLSGAGWYDSEYFGTNDNDSPGTANSVSVPFNKFTHDTRDLHGRDAELLDAFVYARGNLWGNKLASIRVGQHTQLWGESLFLAGNGISYGQAPLDVIKLLSVPGTQAKELFRPVPQVTAQIQPFPSMSLMVFYQWEWEKTRIPAAGSYFSDVDLLDEGGEQLFVAPGVGFLRGADLEASDSGQWGVGTRFRVPALEDWEFGLYYYQFNDRLPQLYVHPVVGTYNLVFPEDIKVVGGSFSTQVGPVNLAGELHARFDMPLVSTPQAVLPGMLADNSDHPLYARGDTLHANLSAIYLLGPSSLWDGGQFLGEIGWNDVMHVNDNEAAMDPTRNEDTVGFRFLFEPAYYQVLPGWDINVPLVLGYNPRGNSVIDQKFNGGADKGGDLSIGLNVTYQTVWKAGLNYTQFFGSHSTQTLADRDFVSLSLQRTF